MNRWDKFWLIWTWGTVVYAAYWFATTKGAGLFGQWFMVLLWGVASTRELMLRKYKRGFKDLARQVMSGEITQAKLIAAVLRYQARKDTRRQAKP